MDNLFLYNKILKNYNNTHYPFNLIENIKDNIISTKNEIELELTFSYEFQKSAFTGNHKSEIKLGGSLLTNREDINLVYKTIKIHYKRIFFSKKLKKKKQHIHIYTYISYT
jgi:predicted ATP-dependent Lon-type protease